MLSGEIAKNLSQLTYLFIITILKVPGGIHLGFLSVTGLDVCRGLPTGPEELDIIFCVGSDFCSVLPKRETTDDTSLEIKTKQP